MAYRRISVDEDCRECPYCGAENLAPVRGHWRAPRLRCGSCWKDCIPNGSFPTQKAAAAPVPIDGNAAMAFIEKLVPRWLPGVRDDVVQEMLLLMLTGDITTANAKQRLSVVVQDVRRANSFTDGPWLFRADQERNGWEKVENEALTD